MKKWITCGLVLTAFVVAPVWAQLATPGGGVARAPQSSTMRMLNLRIPEVTFVDAPFEQVMEWVTDFTQANVNVRWQVLEDAGVEKDKKISLKVKNLRLSQVLWMIMSEAGGTDVKLAYRASGNLLIISTVEDLSQEQVTKVYDVSDLLVTARRFSDRTRLDPSQSISNQSSSASGGGGGGSGGSNIFTGSQNDDEEDRGETGEGGEIGRLILLITQTIEPDSWEVNGGTGRIYPFRGMLVIRNTLLVHQQIGGHLTEGDGN